MTNNNQTTTPTVTPTVSKPVTPQEFLTPFFAAANVDDLFRMNPFELMRQFTTEMNRLTTNWGGWPGQTATTATSWKPAIEAYEKDDQFIIRTELPGMNQQDIQLQLVNNRLLIKGERKQETAKEEKNYHISELAYGSFYRAIPLPGEVDVNQIKATFHNGVLEVIAPLKTQETPQREIPITSNTPDAKAATT
jgi:HSP20 family protein